MVFSNKKERSTDTYNMNFKKNMLSERSQTKRLHDSIYVKYPE